MTIYETLTVIGVLLGIGLGVFNYLDKRKNTQNYGLATTGDFLLDANQAIEIANRRATVAEKERRDAEIEHKKEMASLKLELEDVKRRMGLVEKALAYEIKLVAHLGEEPKIEAISIKRIPIEDRSKLDT